MLLYGAASAFQDHDGPNCPGAYTEASRSVGVVITPKLRVKVTRAGLPKGLPPRRVCCGATSPNSTIRKPEKP